MYAVLDCAPQACIYVRYSHHTHLLLLLGSEVILDIECLPDLFWCLACYEYTYMCIHDKYVMLYRH